MGRIVGVGAVVERDETGQLTGPGRNTVLRACDGQTGPVRDRVTPARRTSRRGMPRGARGGADMGDDTVGSSAGRSTDTVLASPEAIAPEDDATVSALDEPRNGHRSVEQAEDRDHPDGPGAASPRR